MSTVSIAPPTASSANTGAAAPANGSPAAAPAIPGANGSGASPAPDVLTLGEFHSFQAEDSTFLYLVPSAAIFRLDAPSRAVLEALETANRTPAELLGMLEGRFPAEEVANRVEELMGVRAIGLLGKPAPAPPDMLPPKGFPLTTMVLNVTSKCNLACTYCYEYGDDRIVEADSKPRYMDLETARESVDFMFEQGGTNRLVHLTFFGGETLLNFKLLKSTVAYARQRAKEVGKEVDFSLTTNATLLKPEIVDWLAENRVGVTVSIDGPREVQDGLRVFSNGMGSYDIILPKIKDLLARHRTRPIGARVTLTSKNLDVKQIFTHLTEEIGFWEVGFAPVTSSSCRDFSISDAGYDQMLGQFEELAADFLEAAAADRHHGFSTSRHPRITRRRNRPCAPASGSVATDATALVIASPTTRPNRAFGGRGHRRAVRLPEEAPHQQQDGLPHLLGPPHLRRRMLSRGPHPVWHHGNPEPALLRVGAELDRHLSSSLWSHLGAQPGIPGAFRRLSRVHRDRVNEERDPWH